MPVYICPATGVACKLKKVSISMPAWVCPVAGVACRIEETFIFYARMGLTGSRGGM